jgi:hypothetical protein
MKTVDGAFGAFDHNLNLDRSERDQAQEMHQEIREELTDAGVIADSFLQGSFARKTMLKPLKDIDIVCLLDPALWEELRHADGPGKAMESFKSPIRTRWPDVEFDVGDEPAGKALRLSFPWLDFTVDLVPAFETDDEYVLIGDRDEGTWEPSNTRIQLRRVRDRNQATGGRFVHQVREGKALKKNHEPELEFVTGIVVESLAYAAITRKMPDKLAIAGFLNHAAKAVRGPVLEPAGEDDVTVKWTAQERSTAERVFAQAAEQARIALALEQDGDVQGAIAAWHDLLGEDFPWAEDRSVAETMGAWAAGSVATNGRPTASRAAKQQAAPGRSWSSR